MHLMFMHATRQRVWVVRQVTQNVQLSSEPEDVQLFDDRLQALNVPFLEAPYIILSSVEIRFEIHKTKFHASIVCTFPSFSWRIRLNFEERVSTTVREQCLWLCRRFAWCCTVSVIIKH